MTTYVLGGGCFWCLDGVYAQLRGVTNVESGYAGGDGPADYWHVVSGRTGHAEVTRVTFDEDIIPAEVILDMFFLIHDPTSLNRQGADEGTQYRSTMMYMDDTQKAAFQSAFNRAQKLWDSPIMTEIVPLTTFYPAESDHQNYYNQNPEAGYCQIVIVPKIIKARQSYNEWFVEQA
ncbi:MAG TPA: peptide-methionine (S)-S-oxide reductase MsrA [Candidatus Saccharimonadales bacterium]|nr:peptide-methionine (S)-S-oxide reductase MsrA [Candidatus Saccharimonadales bacterium]